jgi:hypothetical protein
MDFLEAAFDLCSFGWLVFPCAPGRKEPAIPKKDGGRGCLDATDDEEIICDWAAKYPLANIGVACGDRSNLLVVDIDAGNDGLKSIADLRARGLKLPPTVSVRTPSGGWHLYYSYSAGPKNSKSLLAKGIDIRTTGGYVVAPPSRLDNGRNYSWHVRPLGSDLPKLPGWALDKLRPREETPFYTERREAGDIEALVIWMENAPPGERNSCLHWASMRAGEAVRRGEIGELEAFTDMLNAGMRVGLDRAEATKTARSGIKRGLRR